MDYGIELKNQPLGEWIFRKILRRRSYMYCKACGYFEDVDDYKKEVGNTKTVSDLIILLD